MPSWNRENKYYDVDDLTDGDLSELGAAQREEEFRTQLLNELCDIVDALKTIALASDRR